MKKIISLLFLMTMLNGCYGPLAFLGPTSTTVASGASGNIARGAFTSSVSYGIKHKTGKLPSEHALSLIQESNKKPKKEKCIEAIKATNSITCAVINKKIKKTKKDVLETKKKIFKISKIENLAKKSLISNRR